MEKGTKMGYDRLDYHIRSSSLNYERSVYIVVSDAQGVEFLGLL